MKTKTKTYLLMAAVLGIWSTIGVKVLSGINANEAMPVMDQEIAAFTPNTVKVQDTFSIQLAERDPFLGTLTRKPKQQTSKKASKTPKIAVDDPMVSFEGVIKKQGGSKQVFVVSINGEQHLLKTGQTINDVTLISGNSKRINVCFNGKTQQLKIN